MYKEKRMPMAAWVGAVAVILGPFYVFPSGNPQPADGFYILAILLLIFGEGTKLVWRKDATVFLAFGFALVIWVMLVNTAWTGVTGVLKVSNASLFYAYNIAVMSSMVLLYYSNGEPFLRSFFWVVAASLIVQVVLSPLGIDLGKYRQELFYNNPNQLGLFALTCGSVIYAATIRWTIKPVWIVFLLMCMVYLIFLTVSRGAMLGCVALLVLFVVKHPRQLIPLVVGVGLIYFMFLLMGFEIDMMMGRYGDFDIGRPGRGYDRMVNHPYYFFLGAGEGAPSRFESDLLGEMHSSWGTLIFSYGLIGFGLYVGMLYQIVRFGGWMWVAPLVPVALYGLSHQGLRSTQYWLLVAFLFCLVLDNRRTLQKDRDSSQINSSPVEG